MKNEGQESNDFTQLSAGHIEELNELITDSVNYIISAIELERKGQAVPSDPLDNAYEAIISAISHNVILYAALRHLEDRMTDVSQDSQEL